MPLVNYSDVFAPVLNGHTDDKINLHSGYNLVEKVGYAKITSSLQFNIPIYLPSGAQSAQERITNQDKRLIIPSGAIINSIALRLPSSETNTITPQYGKLQLGATLIGTTGELAKVATDATYDTTAPQIAAAISAYTPGASAVVNRSIIAPASVTTSTIIVAGSALSMSLVVSNAGSTAAGNGIRTSAGDAFAIVAIRYFEAATAPTYEDMGYLSPNRR